MAKYANIVGGTWVEKAVYSESIPHLFHWDLAYLWVLEKAHLKPRAWESRTQAWRYLVALLLTGQLTVEEETINEPFIDYTLPYGIEKVFWVCLKNTTDRIGVLSPTVLVRPLPDFKSPDLERWRQEVPYPETHLEEQLRHFAQLAVQLIDEPQNPVSFRHRLANILRGAFQPAIMNNPPKGYYQSVPVLRQVVWSHNDDDPSVALIQILLKEGIWTPPRTYVPLCENCKSPLTRDASSPAIEVDRGQFTIACEKPGCGMPNQLNLSDFLLWIRTNKEVIAWNPINVFAGPTNGFPPVPQIQGNEVVFEWGPTQLRAEKSKLFLRLKFSGKAVVFRRIEDILFKDVLVVGKFDEDFSGLPIRLEWLDALEHPEEITIDADSSTPKVVYRSMQIRGWPVAIDWPFGSLSLQREPSLGLGVFPNPSKVSNEWKWYRTFLSGSNRRNFRLQVTDGSAVLPWLLERNDGYPASCSVISSEDANLGVTYVRSKASSRLTESTRTSLYVGVDFGTTNTTIYFQTEDQRNDEPRPEVHGLMPSELVSPVLWYAESTESEQSRTIGDFLPGSQYGKGRADEYLLPSALWTFEDRCLIRWDSEEPTPGAEAETGFKWDTLGEKFALRKAYLKELLLLAMPSMIERAKLSLGAKVHLGFAFPLTFDYTAREKMKELFDQVNEALSHATGLSFEHYYTDESHACVRAFGKPNSEDAVVVADMGGGTMDVALFSDNAMHQIGSIKFAGENYISSLVKKKRPNVDRQKTFFWELRDLIFEGKCDTQYGQDPAAQVILERFCALAFEFLRTMIAAYRHSNPEKSVKLVLVGNGWHLAEAFSGETRARGQKRVFEEYYENLIYQLEDGNLEFYNKQGRVLDRFPSSKHLVVSGALKNAKDRGLAPDEWDSSKLPAGRSLQFRTTQGSKRIEWHELVGEAIPVLGFSAEELRDRNLDFFFDDMPLTQGAWRSLLLRVFHVGDTQSIPYPHAPTLKDQLVGGIQGSPPKVSKGPLQLILEQHWVDELKK